MKPCATAPVTCPGSWSCCHEEKTSNNYYFFSLLQLFSHSKNPNYLHSPTQWKAWGFSDKNIAHMFSPRKNLFFFLYPSPSFFNNEKTQSLSDKLKDHFSGMDVLFLGLKLGTLTFSLMCSFQLARSGKRMMKASQWTSISNSVTTLS